MQRYGKDLDFNGDSAFLFTDRDFLIVSGHLKSNKLHLEQAKDMFKTLERIKEEQPLLKVIVGIDANHFMKYQGIGGQLQ